MVLLSLLVACVSVNNRVQLISNAVAASNELQSCAFTSAKNDNTILTQGLNPENIAFLNWNIYKGNGDNWQKDLSGFAQSHDLMTLQEALLDEGLTALLERHDFDWVMNTAFHLNGTAAGVMTVAGADAVHSCGFKVEEPLIQIPKSTLVSYYAIEGSKKRLLVANIHGINFTFGVSVYRQQLETLYETIKHHDGPMIVAGDFNSWSENRMLAVSELINKLSLSDIEYSVNNKTHVFGNAIDHVFYRQLELISSQVWQVSSSDHNPISVNFRVQSSVF
ncbi:MAG: endonuclease/exonuclease/phosphatase family protein [Gammaproteobacteria bacterium]|nr:endonuclease/exonuclease/phosphatase family protein [Gammaproteobacteria bacterium]